jgi:hypothetical protein
MKLHLDSAAGLAARRLHDPLPEIQSREANGEPISGISSLVALLQCADWFQRHAAADSVSNDSGVSACHPITPRDDAVNYAPIGAAPGSTTPVSTVEELLKENASFHGIGT